MATENIQHAVESRLATNYTDLPIQYDGMKGPLVSGVVSSPPPSTGYVLVEIWDGISNPASLGESPKLRRQTGTIFVSIFTPVGDGTTEARKQADLIAAVFRDAEFVYSGTRVYCREPYFSRLGEKNNRVMGDSVTWFLFQVAIPYFADSFV